MKFLRLMLAAAILAAFTSCLRKKEAVSSPAVPPGQDALFEQSIREMAGQK